MKSSNLVCTKRIAKRITLFSIVVVLLFSICIPVKADPSSSSIENAIAWAETQIDRTSFDLVGGGTNPSLLCCAKFVANAYGSAYAGNNAIDLWYESEKHSGDWNAPRGSLVYFAVTSSNTYGHVALCLGNGNLIEAGYSKIKRSTISIENGSAPYLGWAWPPTRWPGRNSVPGGVPSLLSPANGSNYQAGQTISFQWSDTGAVRYRLEVMNDTGGGGFATDVYATSYSFQVQNTGSWRWQVRSYNGSTPGDAPPTRSFTVSNSTPPPSPTPVNNNMKIEYFNDDLMRFGVVHTDYETVSNINKNWGTGSPDGSVRSDYFSALFTGNFSFEQGWYKFHYDVDDSIKVKIDGECFIDNSGGGSGDVIRQVNFSGNHIIIVEYGERTGDAKVLVNWVRTAAPTPTPSVYGIPTLTSPANGASYQTGQTINFQWSNTGASRYRLEVMNDSGSGGFATDVYATSYSFVVQNVGSWRWQVRSYNGSTPGDAPPTRSFSVSAPEIQIPAPTGVKALPVSYNSVKLEWNATPDVSFYEVYRKLWSTGTYSLIYSPSSNTVTDIGLATGKTYYYKVRTCRIVGSTLVYSPFSSVVSGTPVPSTPTGVKAVSAGYNSAKVTWYAAAGASGYEVWHKLWSTGTFALVSTQTGTSLFNSGLSTNKTYYYKIRPYRLVGTSKIYGKDSAVVSATPIPSAPTSVTAAYGGSKAAKITWSAAPGASGYEIYRKMWSTGTYALVSRQTSTSLINNGLILNKTYYFKVRAYRMVGTTRVYGTDSRVVAYTPLS